MDNLEKQILDVINKPFLAGFATISNGEKPWVRYVMAVGAEDLSIRFCTNIHSRKVSQIKQNPEVHLTCGINNLADKNPYLQIQGIATVVLDQAEKDKFWNEALAHIFKGPKDPNYAIVIVKPYCIEYTLSNKVEPPKVWEKEK